jgi:biotin transport system substrate-specific component
MLTTTPATLIDVLPVPSRREAAVARNVVLVVAATLFTAASAQVSIHLGFTPVQLTLQTFAVLVSGATLGMKRGAASQVLYWACGAVGLPFYANGGGGWETATGATFGYLAGFVAAAAIVGHLAERGHDRNVLTSLSGMVFSSVVIYTFGALWLSHSVGVPVANGDKNAISLGVAPFLAGDLLKIIAAAFVTPALWSIVRNQKD